MKSKRTNYQKKIVQKSIKYYGDEAIITAIVSYDDVMKKGNNTFSINGFINKPGEEETIINGVIHHEIYEYFPELRKYLKWHLCGPDGPNNYIKGTLYHASNKDTNGKTLDEPYEFQLAFKFKDCPMVFDQYGEDFVKFLQKLLKMDKEIVVEEVQQDKSKDKEFYPPKYTYMGFDCEWHECPFNTKKGATQLKEAIEKLKIEFVQTPMKLGVGKQVDLEDARKAAVWPDADLAQLQSKSILEARLPSLISVFQADLKELGFEF